jgi:hypothetical protein
MALMHISRQLIVWGDARLQEPHQMMSFQSRGDAMPRHGYVLS